MSKTLEPPDEVYDRLQKAAAGAGRTPVDFNADATAAAPNRAATASGEKPLTLRERFGDLIGGFRSGSKVPLSENCGEKFADCLEQKRREGRL
jgi:hypothetical protein